MKHFMHSCTFNDLYLFCLQLEFVVQMTCQSCVDAVSKALHGKQGIYGGGVGRKNMFGQEVYVCACVCVGGGGGRGILFLLNSKFIKLNIS